MIVPAGLRDERSPAFVSAPSFSCEPSACAEQFRFSIIPPVAQPWAVVSVSRQSTRQPLRLAGAVPPSEARRLCLTGFLQRDLCERYNLLVWFPQAAGTLWVGGHALAAVHPDDVHRLGDQYVARRRRRAAISTNLAERLADFMDRLVPDVVAGVACGSAGDAALSCSCERDSCGAPLRRPLY